MKIKLEIIEDAGVSKKEMRPVGRDTFQYYVPEGGYDKNDSRHRFDLIKELNYHLRREGIPEVDAYSLRHELDKLEPGRSVWVEIEDKAA